MRSTSRRGGWFLHSPLTASCDVLADDVGVSGDAASGTAVHPPPETHLVPWPTVQVDSDRSDQPHVVIFQHVKDGTTARQVRRALRSQQQPPWLLKANTSTGVLSPNRREVFHYNLPAGRYLLLCYWPDDDTGMPHYLMGMWKLVNLR